MSMENTPVESADLDTFSAELFGQSAVTEEPASSEDVTEQTDDDALETETTNTQEEDDALSTEDEIKEEEAPAEPAPKKTRFQERIDELTAGKREAERKAAELETRLAKLEEAKQTTAPSPAPKAETEGPDPYAKNEDGTDVYALGEYDPAYLKDYVNHLMSNKEQEAVTKQAEQAQATAIEAERIALQESWESKLEPARERYPDFQEKGQELISSFDGIDPAYGEYLSAQIMDLDFGTDVLYYLATHPDEAQAIVESGARKATVALGRLDAKFGFSEEEKQKVRKVSQAPTPPPTNKGAAQVGSEVPDDTNDLDAFERKLFKRTR